MAAGLGFIEFATGDILTAASANGYLASQTVMVFASSAARASAITSPQEGMVTYLKDTNAIEYYSGSAYVAVGGSSGALTFIARTTFSGVASQAFDSVFSATYKSYMAIIENFNGSAGGDDLQVQFRYGTTTKTTGYSGGSWTTFNNSATQAIGNSSDSFLSIMPGSGSSGSPVSATLWFNTVGNSAQKPSMRGNGFNMDSAGQSVFGGYNSDTSQTYTGFLLKAENGGNIAGTVAIYGLATA
jgi:hypothetical protein